MKHFLTAVAAFLLGVTSTLSFLREVGIVDWYWVWITLPLWGPFLIFTHLYTYVPLFRRKIDAIIWDSDSNGWPDIW